MESTESIRDNVRKALQEQMNIRMAENTEDEKKFTEEEIQRFANDTENELYELFDRDVGMKYKTKYRSLIFNIKDRKNLSLWEKIGDGTITPKQLVRLSPEELASKKLAKWRDKELQHQLELIKKSELDLLAANKTYVLKTHKGVRVMETKEAVQEELDPNVAVEDIVIALNDTTVGEAVVNEVFLDGAQNKSNSDTEDSSSRKRDRENSTPERTKKSRRESKRDSDRKKSRSSRWSEMKDREERSTRLSDKKRSSRARSLSKGRSKKESSKEIPDTSERLRQRSRSRAKTKRRSKSREHSRSVSKDRERSHSRKRPRRPSQSQSKESVKWRRSARTSKHTSNTEDGVKTRSRSQKTVPVKAKTDVSSCV